MCEEKLPTFFINSDKKILSAKNILHYKFHAKQEVETIDFLPDKTPVKILITSGASCPDALVESIINRLTSFFTVTKKPEEIMMEFLPY